MPVARSAALEFSTGRFLDFEVKKGIMCVCVCVYAYVYFARPPKIRNRNVGRTKFFQGHLVALAKFLFLQLL